MLLKTIPASQNGLVLVSKVGAANFHYDIGNTFIDLIPMISSLLPTKFFIISSNMYDDIEK